MQRRKITSFIKLLWINLAVMCSWKDAKYSTQWTTYVLVITKTLLLTVVQYLTCVRIGHKLIVGVITLSVGLLCSTLLEVGRRSPAYFTTHSTHPPTCKLLLGGGGGWVTLLLLYPNSPSKYEAVRVSVWSKIHVHCMHQAYVIKDRW